MPPITDNELDILLIKSAEYFQHPDIVDNILCVVNGFNFYIDDLQEGFDNLFGDVLVFEGCEAYEYRFSFLER